MSTITDQVNQINGPSVYYPGPFGWLTPVSADTFRREAYGSGFFPQRSSTITPPSTPNSPPTSTPSAAPDYSIAPANTRVSKPVYGPGYYSIQFRLKEENGQKRYIDGCYYTIYLKNENKIIHGETTTGKASKDSAGRNPGGPGFTEIAYSGDPNEQAFLYLGKRLAEDGFPENRGGEKSENNHDEAPLITSKVYPVEEKKLLDAFTKRLWKPWQITSKGEDFTSTREALRRNAYDIDSNAARDDPTQRNVTVGIGEKVHDGPFVMNQDRLDTTVNYLVDRGDAITKNNIINSIGPATGLRGESLQHAQSEMQFVNGLTDQEAKDRFLNKTYPEHRALLPKYVFVPLHQHEYDAIADLSYNGGKGAVNYKKGSKKYGTVASWLNRGRYYYAGDKALRNYVGEESRRIEGRELFLNGVYAPRALDGKDYQTGNRTPWNHLYLDE